MSDRSGFVFPNDDPKGLKGSGKIGILKWLKDLTWNEVHLIWLGLYAGFVAAHPAPRHEPAERIKKQLNWRNNSWYWKISFVIGYILKVGVLGALAISNQDYVVETARLIVGA